jgi:hypothetical protein
VAELLLAEAVVVRALVAAVALVVAVAAAGEAVEGAGKPRQSPHERRIDV